MSAESQRPNTEDMKSKLNDLGIEDVKWDYNRPDVSLDKLYDQAVDFAQSKILYYFKDATSNARVSTALRLAAFVVLTVGALFPLADATGVFGTGVLTKWGYVVLALGGALAYADQLLGASASWMRSTVTWLTIRKALAEFRHEWVALRMQMEIDLARPLQPPTISQRQNADGGAAKAQTDQASPPQPAAPPTFMDLLQKLKDFRLQIEKIVSDETVVWSNELQKAVKELRGRTSTGSSGQ